MTDVDSDEVELFERVHVKPFADVRGMDFVQVLTRARRRGASAGGDAVRLSPGSFVRVGLLLLLTVVLQLSVVGQIWIFGGNADLVAAGGRRRRLLRAAASSAARPASPPALLLDLAVGGTMGASSLVLTAVGYGVGRFRELRDPSHGLLPMPGRRRRHGGLGRRVRRRVVHARRGRRRERRSCSAT